MKLKKEIEKLVENFFKEKTFEEKSNLTQMTIYRIIKESPYFRDRFEIMRLADIKYREVIDDNNTDELYKNKTIGFGFKEINNSPNHTNQRYSSWIFDNEYNEDFEFSFFLNEEDEKILNNTINIINKSNNFKDFCINTKKELDNNKDFLHKIKYIIKDETLFDFYLKIERVKNDENIVRKMKTKIYSSGLSYLLSKYIGFKGEKILNNKSNIKEYLEDMSEEEKENYKKAKKGHPVHKKSIVFLINEGKNENKYIDIIDEIVFKKEKIKSLLRFKNLLKIKNEKEILNKNKDNIDKILLEINKKFKILRENKNDYKSDVFHIRKGKEYLDEENFPERLFSLGNWDLDKTFGDEFNYTKFEYISMPVNYISDYFVSGNDLEDTVFAHVTGAKKDSLANLSSFSGNTDSGNEYSVKNTIKEIFKFLEKQEIKALSLDFNKDNDKEQNFFNKCLYEVLKEENYNFLVYGKNNDLTFKENFNEVFNYVFDIGYSYDQFPYNNGETKRIKKIQKEMMKEWSNNKKNEISRNELKELKEKFRDKYHKKIKKVNKWKV